MSSPKLPGSTSAPQLHRTRESNPALEAPAAEAHEPTSAQRDTRWNAPTADAGKGAATTSAFQDAATPRVAAQRLGTGVMEAGRNFLGGLFGGSNSGPKHVEAWGKALFQEAKPAPASLAPMPSPKNDLPSDGKLMVNGPNGPGLAPSGTSLDALRHQAFGPQNGKPVKPGPVVLYTTGIQTNAASQAETAQLLANQGHNVIAVRNATEPGHTLLGRTVKDAKQAENDVDLGQASSLSETNPAKENAATLTLATAVTQELAAGRPVHLIGHSQGAAITAAALNVVHLTLESGQPRPPGLSDEQWQAQRDTMRQALSESKVETMGGFGTKFPPGPTYTHYINDGDHVPQTGVGGLLIGTPSSEDVIERGGGAKATFHLFNDGSSSMTEPARAHDVAQAYLAQRARLDQGKGTGTKLGQFVVDLKQSKATLKGAGFSDKEADALLKKPGNELLSFGWNRLGFKKIAERSQELATTYSQFKPHELMKEALKQGAEKYGGQGGFLSAFRLKGTADDQPESFVLDMSDPRGRDRKTVTFTLVGERSKRDFARPE